MKRASEITVGDVIDGWTVVDVCFVRARNDCDIVLVKQELRQEAVTGVDCNNDGTASLQTATVTQAKTTRWFRADEEVSVD